MSQNTGIEMPSSWIQVSLSELFLDPKNNIVDGPFGSNLKASEYQDEGIPVIRIQNIDRNKFIDKNINYVSEEKAAFLSRHSFKSGDIIITKLGDPVGKACFVPEKYERGIIVADLIRARIDHKHMSDKFLLYQLNSSYLIKQFNKFTKGTTRPRIKLSIVRDLLLNLPPLKEQHRIVDTIEELFSELDNGVANLKLAQNQLKVYRQALLKHAFEGKLTKQWRKENSPEPADKLLEKIKAERQQCYEQEIKEWKASVKVWENDGKKIKKPLKPRLIQELNAVESEEFKLFPSLWKVARLSELMINPSNDIVDGPFGSNMKSSDYVNDGVPVIKIQNIERNNFIDKKINYVTPQKAEELKRHSFIAGDIVLTKLGEPLGKSCILPDKYRFGIIVADLIRIRIGHQFIDKKFLNNLINSPYIIKQFEKIARGTTRQRVNLSLVRQLRLCIPPLNEQKEITSLLAKNLSLIDNLEESINSSLLKSKILRLSILKKAFEGKLVPQDPNDEPTPELLKRIEAEKKNYLEEQKELKKKAPQKIKKMSKELSIEEVLKTSEKPMLAKDVWQKSKYKGNIEDFYKELKNIQSKIREKKEGTESFLSLIK